MAKSNVQGMQEKLLIARQEEEERIRGVVRAEAEEMRGKVAAFQAERDDAKRQLRINEEELASAKLKVSMTEREVEALRSDATFMNDAFERIKERNNESIVALRSRTTALEKEREELLATHIREIRVLRKESHSLSAESDELKRMVEDKDSELALLQQTLSGEEFAGEKEIERLRYEKAQLLSSTKKAAANFERKLREATSLSA